MAMVAAVGVSPDKPECRHRPFGLLPLRGACCCTPLADDSTRLTGPSGNRCDRTLHRVQQSKGPTGTYFCVKLKAIKNGNLCYI